MNEENKVGLGPTEISDHDFRIRPAHLISGFSGHGLGRELDLSRIRVSLKEYDKARKKERGWHTCVRR